MLTTILPKADFFLVILLWSIKFTITAGDGSSQELLIKNITQILDLLLKDYDNSQHPNHRAERPTIIKTNMLIRSMGPISEFDMDFSMDCYFRQHWNDPRLRFRGPVENLSLNIKMLEKIWRPDTYFHNGKNSYVHTITLPNKLLRLSKDGDILYSMRLTIKAKCPMCLKNFPMDTQSCPLIIGSYAYTTKQIRYEWHGEAAVSYAQGIGLALSQFDLISSPYKNLSLNRMEGEFSVLQVNFNLVRFAGYFLIQIYVPCILIVVLSFVGFFINREATSDRVGLGVTSILTLSTISLDTRTDLPKDIIKAFDIPLNSSSMTTSRHISPLYLKDFTNYEHSIISELKLATKG
ncbi:unnamed protein product [Allacma fusca]|uniref:Neurotransmitter-gated ion-channel ligand-binding domain-containing protein n=1 Tax=Allacma fusca TaxID=39272 RepID=A0A8J2KAD7_9HEXA|nr:unnamed protein product [Allacma fusca]